MHVDPLWGQYVASQEGRRPELLVPEDNPFGDWKITDRYEQDGTFRELTRLERTATKAVP